MVSQSNGNDERSASMASPGLIVAKASSLALSGGRSGVSRDGDVEGMVVVAGGEYRAAHLEQHKVEGGPEILREVGP